jgi:hypothetical protein
MKLVAITQFTWTDYPPEKTLLANVYLEIGKIYEGDLTPTIYDPQTLKPSEPSYIIKCDDGKYRKFMAEHFLTLEEWRELQLNKIF